MRIRMSGRGCREGCADPKSGTLTSATLDSRAARAGPTCCLFSGFSLIFLAGIFLSSSLGTSAPASFSVRKARLLPPLVYLQMEPPVLLISYPSFDF